METIISYFQSFDGNDWVKFAVEVVLLLFHVVSAILCFRGYHVFCKHADNNISPEASDMKFRKPTYRETLTEDDKKSEVKSFKSLVPQYRLNKVTNLLEESEPLDIVKLVQSSVETALSNVLERLMPETPKETLYADYTQTADDLDILAEALDVAESYREKLGLSDELSAEEVFGKMSSYASDIEKKLKEIQSNVSQTNATETSSNDEARK